MPPVFRICRGAKAAPAGDGAELLMSLPLALGSAAAADGFEEGLPAAELTALPTLLLLWRCGLWAVEGAPLTS